MLLRYRQFVTVLALLSVIASISGFHLRGVDARERPSPRISLSVFHCPPGMTDATLVTVDCTPLDDGFDVDVISIDGTQPKITVANGQHEGHVVRWTVAPSDAEVDHWGLKQTLLPAGSTQYLVQGESVSFDPAPVYDYRFQTSEEDPQTDLSLYVFSSATQGVIIPPSGATGNESASSAAGTETEAAPDQSTTEPPTETEAPAAGSDIAVDAPVDTSHAAPQESATDSETIAQDNVAIRLAADLSSVVIDTVSSGEVVSILSGPIEAGQ
ncbi:MAG: hypothetical protein AB7G88_15780, partial [Thermomicrobiales bacterium]